MSRLPCIINWRTSGAGVSAVLIAIADLLHLFSTNPAFHADFAAIVTGIGLLFAKDGRPGDH